MQIHELNNFNGTPGSTNYLAIDDGSDTSRISGTDLLKPVNGRIDNAINQNKSEAVTLWSGSMSADGGSYTLSESVANFDYIEIYFYNSNTGVTDFKKIPKGRNTATFYIPYSDTSAVLGDKSLEVGKIKLTFSGASVTLEAPRLWFWGGGFDEKPSVSQAQLSIPVRIVGIRYAQLDANELTDLRTAHNGTVYSTARAAREADYNALETEITDAEKKAQETIENMAVIGESPFTISFGSMSAGVQVYREVYIPKGRILTVTASPYSTGGGIRMQVYYEDGTYIESIRVDAEIRYRAKKGITKLGFYSDISTTIQVEVTSEPLYITDYYNPETKKSGMIANDGSIISNGNYHSDFIKVALGEKIIFRGYPGTFGNVAGFYYDENLNFINRANASLREDGLYENNTDLTFINEYFNRGDIYYVSFNIPASPNEAPVLYKESAPYTSVEYGEHLPEDDAEIFNQLQRDYIDEVHSDIPELDELMPVLGYFEKSPNLYDKNAITRGYWIGTNNGRLYESAAWSTSDYIPIEIGKTYTFPVAASHYGEAGAKRIPIFDSSKTCIGYMGGTLNGTILTVTISLDAVGVTVTSADMKYFRVSCAISVIDSYMIVEGTELPEDYSPYGAMNLNENFVLNETQKAQVEQIAGGSTLEGKLIAYNGDSIAESRLATGNTYNGGAYAKMIADLTGGTYQNIAHGGGILASAPGDGGSMPHSVVNTIASMPNNADLICLEGGINDYWRKVPLGDYSESDYSSTPDTTTICGALEKIFRDATQKWVGKPICFVIVHKIKSTVYVANSAGYTFAQAREKMIGICNKYAIPYYDAFAESGLNAYNDIQNTTFLTSNSSGTADGCHPNAAGYEKYYVPQLIALFNKIMPKNQ